MMIQVSECRRCKHWKRLGHSKLGECSSKTKKALTHSAFGCVLFENAELFNDAEIDELLSNSLRGIDNA